MGVVVIGGFKSVIAGAGNRVGSPTSWSEKDVHTYIDIGAYPFAYMI